MRKYGLRMLSCRSIVGLEMARRGDLGGRACVGRGRRERGVIADTLQGCRRLQVVVVDWVGGGHLSLSTLEVERLKRRQLGDNCRLCGPQSRKDIIF